MLCILKQMKIIRNFLRAMITGLSLNQEYLCLRKEKLENGLSVFISNGGNNDVEVTDSHLFLGYKPVIIGIFCERTNKSIVNLISQDELTLQFKDSLSKGKSVAILSLKREKIILLGNYQVTLFLGVEGKHQFINPLHQWVNQSLEKIRIGNRVMSTFQEIYMIRCESHILFHEQFQ
jgi:hypothetical protein